MINDRLIIDEHCFNNAKIILPKITNRCIVLIGGGSGTKKTETSDCLQELLFENKKTSLSISLDDFYYVIPTIRNYNRKKQGLESVGLKEIDWENLCKICEDFKEKKAIHFQRTHRYLDAIEHNTVESEDIDVLVIEGLYSNYLRKFDYGDLSVFLEGNPEQTYEFRLKRRKENEEDSFRRKVVQREFNIVSQLKRYTEIIIPFGK